MTYYELFYRTTKSVSSYLTDPMSNMATQPLKFPNLVTGYQRNPVHANRAAIYTRYTPNEWFQKQIKYYNEADSNRYYSERLRTDTLKVMRYPNVIIC